MRLARRYGCSWVALMAMLLPACGQDTQGDAAVVPPEVPALEWHASPDAHLDLNGHDEKDLWVAVAALAQELSIPDLQDRFVARNLTVRFVAPQDWKAGPVEGLEQCQTGDISVLDNQDAEDSLVHELVHLYGTTIEGDCDAKHLDAEMWKYIGGVRQPDFMSTVEYRAQALASEVLAASN